MSKNVAGDADAHRNAVREAHRAGVAPSAVTWRVGPLKPMTCRSLQASTPWSRASGRRASAPLTRKSA